MSYASPFSFPRRGRRGFAGSEPSSSPAFLPANPFAVPLTRSQSLSMAAAPDCTPGTTRDPILGLCLPDGSDPTRCPPGMRYRVGVGCEFIPQAGGCPQGTQSDPMGISCWPTSGTGVTPTQPTAGGGCPTGYVKDPVLGTACIPTSWPVPGAVTGQGLPSAPGCFLGQVKDAKGNCVYPICGPGLLFNVQTGACEQTDTTQGGYDIVKAACDMLPAGLRPPGCPTGAATGAGTESTITSNLLMLCGLIPAGWPTPPGCGPSTVTPGGLEIPGTKAGGSVTTTASSNAGALFGAIAVLGLVAGGIYVYKKRSKKGKR